METSNKPGEYLAQTVASALRTVAKYAIVGFVAKTTLDAIEKGAKK